MSIILYVFNQKSLSEFVFYISLDFGRVLTTLKSNPYNFTLPRCSHFCTSQQKVDTTLYFYTSFNEHNTPYTVLESDNSESMPDVLH